MFSLLKLTFSATVLSVVLIMAQTSESSVCPLGTSTSCIIGDQDDGSTVVGHSAIQRRIVQSQSMESNDLSSDSKENAAAKRPFAEYSRGKYCKKRLWNGRLKSPLLCKSKCGSMRSCKYFTAYGSGYCQLAATCDDEAPSKDTTAVTYTNEPFAGYSQGKYCKRRLWNGRLKAPLCKAKCNKMKSCKYATTYGSGTNWCQLAATCDELPAADKTAVTYTNTPFLPYSRGMYCIKRLWNGRAKAASCKSKCSRMNSCKYATTYASGWCQLAATCREVPAKDKTAATFTNDATAKQPFAEYSRGKYCKQRLWSGRAKAASCKSKCSRMKSCEYATTYGSGTNWCQLAATCDEVAAADTTAVTYTNDATAKMMAWSS
eukprot:TRINITY_DN1875_c0_g1_i1.p1 TRINITY_DN1875_c0_g1~~TRINITY_DN1875_c0_g1_i1.p1  ORF type:complete len:375 (-),score=38.66 TRINITY_DN1875_c0_g1_i1:379-1503(-)